MKKKFVKDIMVPISDYASVSGNITLKEAIRGLESQKKKYGEKPYRHRSLIVTDDAGNIVGKLSQVDIMRALEPNYEKIGNDVNLSRFGLSGSFVNALQKNYDLWQRPISELCKSAETIKVTDVMYTLSDHQHVDESDTMDTAVHQFVMGQHQSLLVTKGKKIVGILRSTDVFNVLCDMLDQSSC